MCISLRLRTMQVIFLKILRFPVVVVLFLVLSMLLMINILSSAPKHENRLKITEYESNDTGSSSRNKSNSGRRIKTVDAIEDQTINDAFGFNLLSSVSVWNPQEYEELFTPKPACKLNMPLLILVTSSPEHYDRRKAIRETWGHDWSKPNNTDWRTIFLIGQAKSSSIQYLLEKESHDHGDILLGNYLDTYRNLTLKVQHGFAWAVESCQPQFLLKTDDDCFVNSLVLTDFLISKNKNQRRLYAGFHAKTLSVVRDKKSRWYVSRENYRPAKFPSYASGVGYVLSLDVVEKFVTTAKYVVPFAAEDAYTGLLAMYTDIPLLDSARFALNNVNWRLCNYLYLLVVHGVTPEQQVLGLRYSIESRSKCKGQREVTKWN